MGGKNSFVNQATGGIFAGGGADGATQQSNAMVQAQLDETRRQKEQQSKKLYAQSLAMLRASSGEKWVPDVSPALPIKSASVQSAPRAPLAPNNGPPLL